MSLARQFSRILERELPEPDFLWRDPEEVTRQLIKQYEVAVGKTLYPAQVERILIDVHSYRESLKREAIQDAAKLNLVRYSRGVILDYLGENVGVMRLPSSKATATQRFHFNTSILTQSLLPQGVVVAAGNISFATTEAVVILAGASFVDCPIACVQTGVIGNGYTLGQINALEAPVAGFSITSTENITNSVDGNAEEDDDQLRERIVLAPEQFSNAGSEGGYMFFARSAHPSIIDVAVRGPKLAMVGGVLTSTNGVPPGVVKLYPLTKTGLPSAAIKAAVLVTCNADDVRPLTDFVEVLDPIPFDYTITAELTVYVSADPSTALTQAQVAVQQFVADISQILGKDIVRSQLIELLHTYGVYSVNLIEPATSAVLDDQYWPRNIGINISVAGVAVG